MAQLVKNLPAVWETWVQPLGWEDPLEKGMATYSIILAWRIPWTVYPWGHKEWDTTEVTYSTVTVTQSRPTLCNPMDSSLPGSSIHGILQARILSGLPFPSPGDLPNPGMESRSPTLQVDYLPAEPQWKPKNTGVGWVG